VSRAQDFETLVEDALKRQQQGQEPAPGEAQPFPPLPQGAQPAPTFGAPPGQPTYGAQPGQPTYGAQPAQPEFGAPPGRPTYDAQPGQPTYGVQPQFRPSDPGPPKPYTPPVIAKPKEEKPAPTPETANAAAGEAPAATAEAPAVSGDTPAAASETAASASAAPKPGAELTREQLSVEAVNGATFSEEALAARGANPLVLKAQVLLDRAGASPGAIDAYAGGNLRNAISAVETVLRQQGDGQLNRDVWTALHGDTTTDVLGQYTITDDDLARGLTPSMLADRFHMDAKLLAALNPDADVTQAGTTIWVTMVESQAPAGKVASIVAYRGRKQVRAYDAEGRLVFAYPATIGSEENPVPVGDHTIAAVTGGAGDSGPSGSVWIDLTDPGYSIQGSADPTKVGKPASTGCVRLTNWDATELASAIEPGVVVSFVE